MSKLKLIQMNFFAKHTLIFKVKFIDGTRHGKIIVDFKG